MNVDIRLIADVTLGCVDVFIAPKDDAFVVKWSPENKVHTVSLEANSGFAEAFLFNIFSLC